MSGESAHTAAPLTPEELAEERRYSENGATLCMRSQRLLATIDAKDREIAAMRAALEAAWQIFPRHNDRYEAVFQQLCAIRAASLEAQGEPPPTPGNEKHERGEGLGGA